VSHLPSPPPGEPTPDVDMLHTLIDQTSARLDSQAQIVDGLDTKAFALIAVDLGFIA
jgi:hypothetical protein